jgi:glycosyltransferase involved in cell wall biosynthesis
MHFVESLGVGGMENGVVNLANHLDRERFRVSVCCFAAPGSLACRVEDQRAVIALNYAEGRHVSAVGRLAALLRGASVDVFHTHGWGARSFLGLAAGLRAGIPRLVNGEHGVLHDRKLQQRALQRMMARVFDGTLSVSAALKQKLIERLGIPADRIVVIRNGVDTARFAGGVPAEQAKRDLGVPVNTRVIGVVGSLKPQKNQAVAIEAVALLAAESFPVTLALVGDGPDRQRLARLAGERGLGDTVRFLGNRTEMPAVFSAMDALVSCSVPDHEGLSNVLLEAMASGVPVLTSDSVGAREVIEDGRSGVVFDYRDARDLANRCRSVLADETVRRGIVDAGRARVRESFSIAAMVRNYEDYYGRVLSRSSSSRPWLRGSDAGGRHVEGNGPR